MKAEGTRVLVTGGARRIGREIVKTFAASGCRLIIHFRDSEVEAGKLLEEIGGTAAGHTLMRGDFSDPREAACIAETLPEDLSVLVNNASVFVRKTVMEESFDEAYRQFAVNFFSPVELMKGLWKRSRMPELSVVNLLDGGCAKVPADSFSYALSKKVLAEAVKAAAKQYAPRMRVNGIAPGPAIPPPGLEHLKMAKTLAVLPLGRPADPQEIASTVFYAAFSSSMTGSILNVDCGSSLL